MTDESKPDNKMLKRASTILTENTDAIIAISVVVPTIAVLGYQSIVGVDITMPTEPAMLILGFYFGRKVVK